MATHATMPVRRRTRPTTPAHHGRTALSWAMPLVLGVILGFWAFFIKRDGGTTTDGQIWLGVISGVAFAALCYALARSTVLACWGLAFTGIAAGALGMAGHAGASLDHINAVNAIALHLIAVAVWAGGLEGRGLALAPVSAMIRRPAAEEASAQQPAAPRTRAQ